ncbi:MAG: hypothetical protein U0990_08705 [Candidatus Nanopelagicales bacterium]|nr:hypothetical protein [Candidatus Nanopelagicales bacterium]MDZ4250156.1 hypothetical protein [Candidatus Nanopelagicales bacterium]
MDFAWRAAAAASSSIVLSLGLMTAALGQPTEEVAAAAAAVSASNQDFGNPLHLGKKRARKLQRAIDRQLEKAPG